MATNRYKDTTARVDEIADGIYRISVPAPGIIGGFTFNQFLILDDEPLLFETGTGPMFPVVRAAIERIMPISRLRYISFSHGESDECGALPQFLEHAPQAVALVNRIQNMVVIGDSDLPVQLIGDGEELSLGRHRLRWFDTPHMPHCWESGLLMETTTGTLFCSDVFTQGGADTTPFSSGDILDLSERLRGKLAYYSNLKGAGVHLERLAVCNPQLIAPMHGSAWRGDGASLLRELSSRLAAD